jgi:hypothetical protein
MMNSYSLKTALTVFYFFIIFYLVGVLVIENEVNYRTWLLVGINEFPEIHKAFDHLLTPFLKVPLTIGLLVSWIMVFINQPKKTRILFLSNAIFLTAFVVISLAVHVPIHNQLNEIHDIHQINRLIETNTVYRLPLVIIITGLNLWLLFISFHRK